MASPSRYDEKLRAPLYLLLLIGALLPPAAADNEEKLQGQVACVYPVSGQYGAISRWVYYALLLFGIVAQREVWLIAGALATAMSYSATAAVHAVLLAASTAGGQPVLDLDLAGVWAVLGAALFSLWPVLGTSRTLLTSPFQPIFRAWAMLIALGALCLMVPVYLTYPKEPACLSTTGQLMQHPYQVGQPGFNCSYTCFDSRRILRAPSEIQAYDAVTIFGNRWGVYKALAGYVVNATVVITIMSSGLGLAWHRRTMRRKARKDPSLDPDDTSHMTINILHPRDRGERVGAFFFVVNQGISIAAVCLCEIYLLGAGLPMGEQPYNVSQWGGAVAVLFIIVAASINKYNEWRAQQRPAPDPEAPRAEALTGDLPISPASPEVQEEPKDVPPPEPAAPSRSVTVSRTFSMPVREIKTGFWDKLRDFLRFLREPPSYWQQPPETMRSPPGLISRMPRRNGRAQ